MTKILRSGVQDVLVGSKRVFIGLTVRVEQLVNVFFTLFSISVYLFCRFIFDQLALDLFISLIRSAVLLSFCLLLNRSYTFLLLLLPIPGFLFCVFICFNSLCSILHCSLFFRGLFLRKSLLLCLFGGSLLFASLGVVLIGIIGQSPLA